MLDTLSVEAWICNVDQNLGVLRHADLDARHLHVLAHRVLSSSGGSVVALHRLSEAILGLWELLHATCLSHVLLGLELRCDLDLKLFLLCSELLSVGSWVLDHIELLLAKLSRGNVSWNILKMLG